MFKFHVPKKGKIIVFLFLFLILCFYVFHRKNYVVDYTINDFAITEKYNKEENGYQFLINYENQEFLMLKEHKYIYSKKLIQNVFAKQKEDIICLFFTSKKISLYPLCKKEDAYISYHLIEDEELIPASYKSNLLVNEKEYNALKLYSLEENKYYLWNYTGFYVVTDQNVKEIKLFNSDIYSIPLTYKVGNYLVIANYDEKYNFNKFYVINTKNDKIRELKLKDEISFDSYFLGSTEKKLYLIDKKNKAEYELDPKHLQIKNITNKTQGTILQQDEWESISIQSLINNEISFTHKENTCYEIRENTLYKIQNQLTTKISNKNVKAIVSYDKDKVFYLVDDSLYSYDDQEGEKLIINNFEWNFNYENMIYIF